MITGFTPHGIISKKKRIYWESQLFALIRSFSDGITFFRFNINLDRYIDDHAPAFQLELTILNLYFHVWVYQNNFDETNLDAKGIAIIDEDEYEKMCKDLKFFNITIEEFDGLASDYLDQGISPFLCYKLAYKDLLKSRNIL
jgi:hypothetical protein